MSSVDNQIDHIGEMKNTSGVIEKIIQPQSKDLGGFFVRRAIPSVHQKKLGPWVFIDHFGPHTFPAGEGLDVRPHPHIGLATVTYLFEGEILHRDSLGNTLSVLPGEINLMVAGRGIVHSERKNPATSTKPLTLHGLQMWLALPEHLEETEPAFYHYSKGDIPSVDVNGVNVRLLIGSAYGAISPVQQFFDTLYFEAHLQTGQCLQLPYAEERGIYVLSGALRINDSILPDKTLSILNQDKEIIVEATEDTCLALIGGEKIGQRFIDWNFVSSKKERIEQAKRDWKENRFDKVKGDEIEFIPLPE